MIAGSTQSIMEAPAWHHSKFSFDSRSMTKKRKDSSNPRKTSKMKGDDCGLWPDKHVECETEEPSRCVDAHYGVHVFSRSVQLSRGVQKREWTMEEPCSKRPAASQAWEVEEVRLQEFKRQNSKGAEGRKVSALLYRLEETGLSITTQEGEIHPFEQAQDFPEPKREKEMSEQNWLSARINNFDHQESFEREAAGGSTDRINTFQGTLRQIMRSDSESSIESRQVNKLSLNSPGDKHVSVALTWLDDAVEPRNGDMDNPALQSKQEMGGQLLTLPDRQDTDFRQLVDCDFWPESSPDSCPVALMGAEETTETADSDKVAEGLEIKVSALLNFALISEEAEKHSREDDSRYLETGKGVVACDKRESVSPSNSEPGCLPLPIPVAEVQPAESLKSTTTVMSVTLLSLCKNAKEGDAFRAGTGRSAKEELLGDRNCPSHEQSKRLKKQEDEKALKVADVKKTFEKQKLAAEKAMPPARKGEMGTL